MIISHKNRFVFVKTRKTASTSVEIALSALCGARDVITVEPAEDEALRLGMSGRGYQNTVIALQDMDVRSWARMVRLQARPTYAAHLPARRVRSLLGCRRWDEYLSITIERNPWDRAISMYWWTCRNVESPPSLLEFLRLAVESNRVKISNWSLYTENDKVIVDEILRYEDLSDGFTRLWQIVGGHGLPVLPRAKGRARRDRRHYSEVLGPTERDLISKACRREIEHFGYEF